MRRLQALPEMNTPEKKKRAGQSLIEMALALPIMLIMISGLIEFGFALNEYLNSLDAAREAARFATDGDPLDRDLVGGISNTDCGTTLDFYMQSACIAQQTMSPVTFNPATDDVVISVFRVLSGTVIDRWPNCEPDASNDCPFDASPLADVMGEWHLYGRGDGCDGLLDDDGDGLVDDGCGPIGALGTPEFCNPNTDETCHPSRLTNADVQARIDVDAPDSAVLLVEVFYDYPHVMRLPWITPFVPDPLPLHTYTILPLPAAEPSLTITGTVTQVWADGTPKTTLGGVTILFNNGMTAITEDDGSYLRTGLSSGWLTWQADTAGTDCPTSTPASYTEHLTINNLYDKDFELTGCINVAATQTQAQAETNVAATANQAATNVAGTSTQQAAADFTATAAASAGLPTDTPPAATETATVSPTCSESIVSPFFSEVMVVNPVPPNTQADGSSTLEVLVRVRNECATLVNMSNRTVTLSSSRGGADTIAPASAQTDGLGEAAFFVSSSTMSEWDVNNHDFVNSLFTAVADGVTLNSTPGGAFMCVGGVEGAAVNGEEVMWRFQNDTGISRRLVQIDVFGTHVESPSFRLFEVMFNAISVWSSGSSWVQPVTIASGDWLGVPSDRIIPANGTLYDLLLIYEQSTTSNTYILNARWDNGSGASFCNSNSVTVIR